LKSSKKIINFTPTGTQTTRENSFAPLEENEIIDSVIEANELGITLVHLHARDENLKNTYKVEHFSKIVDGIRKYCPDLVICVSMSGRNFPEVEKRTEVLRLMPDMASLTLSSLNFQTGASINQPDVILKLIEQMEIWGVIPELECFDTGMVNMANHLISKSILKPPFYFNVILGNLYNSQSDILSVANIKHQLPENSITTLGGIGVQQLRSNIYGLIDFDGIRVGLEDNLMFRKGEKATNSQLIKRVHRIMTELDLEVMSPIEFKKMGYANRNINNR
jgi:3-keto-5-aminohexanoate cleavage enzyme